MIVLGITSSFKLVTDKRSIESDALVGHDSAAVLVRNGRVVAAIEEERLNRIKHSDKAPILAMKYCLDSNNIGLRDIDMIAVNFNESTNDYICRYEFLKNLKQKEFYTARQHIHRIIREAFGEDIDDKKICFVPHHKAHSESAFAMSGFNESLVLNIDGRGDDSSGTIESRDLNKCELLYTIPPDMSLGQFYINVINHLGYKQFDEYKVMGLAPYGNPKEYIGYFKKLYKLLPEGKYNIKTDLYHILFSLCLPRRKGELFSQIHKDIAAALQFSLEDIIIHMLRYYKEVTGHTNLCMSGGVAHNCSVNGKILYSGLFENIFIQPAAHDAGTALGAALYVNNNENKMDKAVKLEHVYWGTDISDSDEILQNLKKWDKFIKYEKLDNATQRVAKLLSEGSIIGWVQGRSEFGPRALGNRSILADPRPAENKRIINEMVKKRESYRPFAPSVQEEYVEEYFVIPTSQKSFPFMNLVLNVKEEKQGTLGAITHVDGTARVQTVAKETNQRYWELINEFGKLTGIHILLNTSFNNNAEPIVDSIEDAIITYLTTKLHNLVIGDYLISKKNVAYSDYLDMIPSLLAHTIISESNEFTALDATRTNYYFKNNYDQDFMYEISGDIYRILINADGEKTLNSLIKSQTLLDDRDTNNIIDELIKLWENRLIKLLAK